MLVWATLLVTVLTLAYLRWRSQNRKLLEISKQLPGPPTWPLLGNAWMFMGADIFELFFKLTKQYGNIVRFWLGPDLNIIVSEPEDLRILLTSSKTSEKGVQYKYMRTYTGDGLLGGSGPLWRKHRKLSNPNFSRRATEGLTELFNEEASALATRLRRCAGQELDLYHHVVRATTYTVCRGIMGISKEETDNLPQLEEVVDLSPRMYNAVFERMTKWWHQIEPVYWLLENYKLQKEFTGVMDTVFGTILKHRVDKLKSIGKVGMADLISEEDSKKTNEFSVIDRFLLSGEMGYTELIQKSFTVFTASQEATGKIASFLLLMMAYHPECQEKLYKEILEVVGEDGPVTEEHLRQMPYLEMIFKEIIRLFPIGVALQRKVVEDITISNNITLPAGCSLVIPIYHIQRDTRYWQNPNAFDPERFTPENSKGRPAYAYIPFSLGPMDCLGRHFGTKLVKTIGIEVVRKFKLSSNQLYKDLKVIPAISAKSANGYKAVLTPRGASTEAGDARTFSTNLQQNNTQMNGLNI